MKKFLTFPVGILIGAALMFGASVYADDVKNVIGLTVEGQFPVTVNGVAVEEPAIVVNDISYLPTRAIGEAFNSEVSFNAQLGITITSKPEVVMNPMSEITISREEIVEKLEETAGTIAAIKEVIRYLEASDENASGTKRLNDLNAELTRLESQKAALEAQLAETP